MIKPGGRGVLDGNTAALTPGTESVTTRDLGTKADTLARPAPRARG